MLPGLGSGHPPTEEACVMPHTVEPGQSRRNLTTVDGSGRERVKACQGLLRRELGEFVAQGLPGKQVAAGWPQVRCWKRVGFWIEQEAHAQGL